MIHNTALTPTTDAVGFNASWICYCRGFWAFFFSFLWDSCQDELYVLFLRAMSNVCVNL